MSNTFESNDAKASYGIGRQMGDQLVEKPFSSFDIEAAIAGFIDGAKGNALQVSADDINAAFKIIQGQIQQEQSDKAKELGGEGAAFLEGNAKDPEVTVLESGLQYKVLTEGTGEKPTNSSTVRTHYHGTLIDGTVFDSSVNRGQPAEFPVSGVIAGWTEALQLMPVGSKWRLFVPYNLAYGERGAGGAIGPYATLIFEVELLAIVS
ncbi:FKBP-type peptidyl-prolyl cis-trans isomerase [Halioxenophilus aromaticivorans]|uniref:Peptidyl-prolyl cis-trans isomerase n=1 Tax=Halioxenophilus aromaticivorans TaxID=1306992 RepID=A0AAV3TZ23_9ALTE